MRKEKLAQDATLKREDERAMINNKVGLRAAGLQRLSSTRESEEKTLFGHIRPKGRKCRFCPLRRHQFAGASAVAGPDFPSRIFLF